MKFTIVTPSFNQAAFLPKTLASIESQTCRDYEHLIFDPGSSDGSLVIAGDYCARNPLATLFKGRDRSQTHAINLGFGEARGDILCWLNSDDRYAAPDVLDSVACVFAESPEVDIVYGRGIFVSPEGAKIKEAFVHRNAVDLRKSFANSLGILQPSLFMRRSVFDTVGPFDQRMNYSFDYEYWARCAAFGLNFRFLDKIISEAVIHDDAKTIRARGVSLAESVTVGQRYYDFLSVDWVRRTVDQEQNGADGITASSEAVPEALIADRFRRENVSGRALARYFNDDPTMNEATRKGFTDWVLPTIRQAYISAWDANYFDMGTTLIASIHRYDPERYIFVCDIGMTEAQCAFLRQLRNIVLLKGDFPAYSADWQRNPKNYVFKNVLFATLAERLAPDTALLWVDAGVSLCRRPEAIFDLIEADGYFFIDHDDSRHWPLFNASFTSDAAIRAASFTWAEMAGPHVISCLYGLLTGSSGHALIREAAALAHIEPIAVGDKHPPDAEKKKALAKAEQAQLAVGLASRTEPVGDLEELRRIFGYYGHRQDQSILSALVMRYSARISSARKYCPSNDASSEVSKENWFEGVSRRLGEFRRDDFNPGGVTFHHRGLVKDFSGLRFDFERQRVCAILGNGPSLAEVDFVNLVDTDGVGMNAAYRYWKTVDWYPALYCCLDMVVGMSHKEAILDLVRHQRRYGIRQFLLRQNLFDWLAEQGATEGVVCFDLIREGFEVLHPEPVTTGSHALAWASAVGYDRFIVTGVDCNYVEQVGGAEKKADKTLEITTSQENPNYFFSGYQQVGDKYNIPNPSKDLHIRSWRNVGAKLAPEKVTVNVSAISRMDAFPKLPLDTAMSLLRVEGRFDRDLLVTFCGLIASGQAGAEAAVPTHPRRQATPGGTSDARVSLLCLVGDLLLGHRRPDLAASALDDLQAELGAEDPLICHARKTLEFVRLNGVSETSQ